MPPATKTIALCLGSLLGFPLVPAVHLGLALRKDAGAGLPAVDRIESLRREALFAVAEGLPTKGNACRSNLPAKCSSSMSLIAG